MWIQHEPAGEFAGNARFRIVRRIGAGGLGLVFEVVDREHGVRVALKTLQRLGGETLLRFKNEFRLLQGIHHPNLIRLGELFEDGGHWFFTMELLHGVDFMTHVVGSRWRDRTPDAHRTVTNTGAPALVSPTPADPRLPAPRLPAPRLPAPPQPPAQAPPDMAHGFDGIRLRAALRQLAQGLDALHRAGMVHRDIKPQNVMVCAHDRVVLLDFGLVSEKQPRRSYDTDRNLLLGTPSYMAPEQAAGQPATPASDWYAVGSMLYEALTGTLPFAGPLSHLLVEKQRRDPVRPSLRVGDATAVPPDLEALCMQLLARDPADRPTGAEVLALLDGAAHPAAGARAGTRAATAGTGADAHAPDPAEAQLVGRARELGVLRDALARCAPGQPVMALVHGSSGMGKTALVEHFARQVHERDEALVLRGRCYEREDLPYKALDGVVDELSRYLQHLRDQDEDDEDADDGFGAQETASIRSFDLADYDTEPEADIVVQVARELRVLARLFPVLDSVLRPAGDSGRSGLEDVDAPMHESAREDMADPGELRRRAFAALKALLTLAAGRQPLVILIDDMQWGDMDSAALLSALLSPPDAPGMLLVASFRSEEARSPVIAALRDSAARTLGPDQVCELEIGPLAEDECQALARVMLRQVTAAGGSGPGEPGHGADQRLLRAVTRESGGNPFFVGEIARCLAMPAGGRSMPAPGHLRLDQVLVERRRQLHPAARALLDVVAVAGRPIAQGVAMRAAGLDQAAPAALAVLRAGHFVRTRGPGLRDAVETYHDRIREAVVARMDPAALRDCHARLAAALEDAGSDDAEMLAAHHLGAGQHDRAAHWALVAAAHAEHALAFDRAAQMYRQVLDMGPVAGTDPHLLHLRLGDALAGADRSADAARAYLRAAALARPAAGVLVPAGTSSMLASGAPGTDLALECKRRAAEQLLRSGSIDEGTTLLREVLAAAGLHVPRTQRGALLSLLLRRVQLRLRGDRYRPRAPAHIPAHERQRADMCWSGAVGLGMVDPVRGADFGTRCLLMALRQGDEARIALALALEASHLASGGGRTAARVAALIDAAEGIARRLGDPHALGVSALARTATGMLEGRWRDAREHGEHAERIFREQCAGAAWEIGTALTFQYTALYYLGEWKVLRERTTAAVRRALERNDLYTLAGLASFTAYCSLMDDDVQGARAAVRRAAVQWQVSGYHMQNYLQLLASLQIDLYAGDGAAAWHRLEAALPTLSRALLMRVQSLRIIVAHSRARSALALVAARIEGSAAPAAAGAEAASPDTEHLLRAADQAARAMERERMPWGTALAALVRAGVAACRGERAQALALLDRAIQGADATDMGFFAAAARLRKGRLLGGAEGYALAAGAEARIRAEGLVNPGGLASMLAPGFPALV